MVVSLGFFSAIIECVPHEKRENRGSKMRKHREVIELPLTSISFAMGWTSVFRQPVQKPIDLLMMKIRTKVD
ncbi:MAG: hypothetical protein EOO46_16080 [Flavobacterium sp.]|nr:MAG: hypothetical protein EOO46_16080 [Flavobacterium sp.]